MSFVCQGGVNVGHACHASPLLILFPSLSLLSRHNAAAAAATHLDVLARRVCGPEGGRVDDQGKAEDRGVHEGQNRFHERVPRPHVRANDDDGDGVSEVEGGQTRGGGEGGEREGVREEEAACELDREDDELPIVPFALVGLEKDTVLGDEPGVGGVAPALDLREALRLLRDVRAQMPQHVHHREDGVRHQQHHPRHRPPDGHTLSLELRAVLPLLFQVLVEEEVDGRERDTLEIGLFGGGEGRGG